MVNTERLQRTLEHIKTDPTQWDQVRFNACFAGWTVRLNDAAVTYDGSGICPALLRNGAVLTPLDIDREARALLGLDRDQSIRLFCGGNSLADLEVYVSALIEGRPMPAHAHGRCA